LSPGDSIMADSTLTRHIKRLNKAAADQEKIGKKADKSFKKLGRNFGALGKELFRPNDKVMDVVAKYMETVNLLVSTTVDYVNDVSDILPEVTNVIRERRQEQGYYSFKELEKAVGQAAKATRRRSAATSDESVDASTPAN